jgi:OOP family OmpA-OmpF porin
MQRRAAFLRVSLWWSLVPLWLPGVCLAQSPTPAPRADSATPRAPADDARQRSQQLMRLLQIAGDPRSTPEQKKKALAEFTELAQQGRRARDVPQPQRLDLPEAWRQPHRVERDATEAELLVRVGDIDNLGFGWPAGFDPFSGKSTPIHRYPWAPEADDPPGTDRIMVVSGYRGAAGRRKDGYTHSTTRPDNLPQALQIAFDPAALQLKAAVLQMFVDDFQAPVWGSRYVVRLDGKEAPDIALVVNRLSQTGPIGKLLNLQLLPEYLPLLADGKLAISVDDPHGDVGDGFAFDFVRLLVNPRTFAHVGTLRGIVLDKKGKPIAGALVSAGNIRQATTGADGRFELRDVPAGLAVTTASHPDYITGSAQEDVEAGGTVELVLELAQAVPQDLAARLESEGKVDLYGIYFDVDKATLKPESEPVLRQVLTLLGDRPQLQLGIAGHTDSQAGDAYNLELSLRRAQAVAQWLVRGGVDAARLDAKGFGETRPVADNASAAGRALNRRVEIRDTDF